MTNQPSPTTVGLTPRTIVVTGPSAAGKSTVAGLLARRFSRGVHVEGDWFRRSIVRARAEMAPSATDEALRQLRLRYELSAAAAEGYRRAGFGVVVEDVVAGPLLEEYVALLTTEPVDVIVLLPSLSAISERERGRGASGYESWSVPALYDLFDRDTPRIGHWIDSSRQSPDQTVDAVVQSLRETDAAS